MRLEPRERRPARFFESGVEGSAEPPLAAPPTALAKRGRGRPKMPTVDAAPPPTKSLPRQPLAQARTEAELLACDATVVAGMVVRGDGNVVCPRCAAVISSKNKIRHTHSIVCRAAQAEVVQAGVAPRPSLAKQPAPLPPPVPLSASSTETDVAPPGGKKLTDAQVLRIIADTAPRDAAFTPCPRCGGAVSSHNRPRHVHSAACRAAQPKAAPDAPAAPASILESPAEREAKRKATVEVVEGAAKRRRAEEPPPTPPSPPPPPPASSTPVRISCLIGAARASHSAKERREEEDAAAAAPPTPPRSALATLQQQQQQQQQQQKERSKVVAAAAAAPGGRGRGARLPPKTAAPAVTKGRAEGSRPYVARYTTAYAETVGVLFVLSTGVHGALYRDGSCMVLDPGTALLSYRNRHGHRFSAASLTGRLCIPRRLRGKLTALLWLRDTLAKGREPMTPAEPHATSHATSRATSDATEQLPFAGHVGAATASAHVPFFVCRAEVGTGSHEGGAQFEVSNAAMPYPSHVYYASDDDSNVPTAAPSVK